MQQSKHRMHANMQKAAEMQRSDLMQSSQRKPFQQTTLSFSNSAQEYNLLTKSGNDYVDGSSDPNNRAYFNKSTFEVDKNLGKENSLERDSYQMTPSELHVNDGQEPSLMGSISNEQFFGNGSV